MFDSGFCMFHYEHFSELQMPKALQRSYRTQQKKEVPYNHSLRMLTLDYLFSVKNWSKSALLK